jgi:hypothetical protein
LKYSDWAIWYLGKNKIVLSPTIYESLSGTLLAKIVQQGSSYTFILDN